MRHKISAKSLNDFGKTAGKDLWAWKVQKKHKYINSNLSHYNCYYSWLAVQNIDPPSLQKKKKEKTKCNEHSKERLPKVHQSLNWGNFLCLTTSE